MNSEELNNQISIADKLLQQLQDEYAAVLSQNIIMPKQNIQPQQDPDNPYQPLQFDQQDDIQQEDNQYNQCKQQFKYQQKQFQKEQQKSQPGQKGIQSIKKQIQQMRITQIQSNPQIKQLIEVQPTDQSIFTNLPHKQFNIDQDKIKSFALSMDIDQPEWAKDQKLCKQRIQSLFVKKNIKPFTKI